MLELRRSTHLWGDVVQRSPGPFDYYQDQHGTNGDKIRASSHDPRSNAKALQALAGELEGDDAAVVKSIEGDIETGVRANTLPTQAMARTLAAKGTYAVGLVDLFASYVDTFDVKVDILNLEHARRVQARVGAMMHQPEYHSGKETVDRSAVSKAVESELRQAYKQALTDLDDAADEVARLFNLGPSDDNVRALIRHGLIPLSAATLFPTLVLTDYDKKLAAWSKSNMGFRVGPPSKPPIAWDEDFEYDSKDAGLSDYLDRVKWVAKLRGGQLIRSDLDDATELYRHFWDNNGDPITVDLEEGYREDSGIKTSVDDEIARAKMGAEQLIGAGNRSFSMTGDAGLNSTYPTTENWAKTIGGHQLWSSADVTVDGNKVSRKVTVNAEDHYNFNRSQQDIATGAPDDDNGRFIELGWAKPFDSHGDITRTITWDLGEAAPGAGNGDPERNPGREDREDERDSGDPDRTSRPDNNRDSGGWRGH